MLGSRGHTPGRNHGDAEGFVQLRNLSVTLQGPDLTVSPCVTATHARGGPAACSAADGIPREQATIEGESRRGRFPARAGSRPHFVPATAGGRRITSARTAGRPCTGISPSHRTSSGRRRLLRRSDFPFPFGSGFEAYKHPWTMNVGTFRFTLNTGLLNKRIAHGSDDGVRGRRLGPSADCPLWSAHASAAPTVSRADDAGPVTARSVGAPAWSWEVTPWRR